MFLLACGYLRLVSLPHGSKGWSVFSDYDITSSYSLILINIPASRYNAVESLELCLVANIKNRFSRDKTDEFVNRDS